MVQQAPSEEKVYTKFINFLYNAIENNIPIIGHNIKIFYADTLMIARKLIYLSSYKQECLYNYFDVTNKDAHRA